MKNFKRNAAAVISAFTLALTGTASVVPAVTAPAATANAVDDGNDDWLHAEGSRLYDMNGNEVWLTGANWFGFNCSENCVHYLWSADVDDVLSEVADRGINIIRFPIASELIVSWMSGKPNEVNSVSGNADPAFTINPDFVLEDGKTLKNSMEIFDIIMQKCKKYGIKAFVDIHSPHTDNSGHNYNLWYGKAGVTTDVWIDSLVWLADKYKNDDTILAYDLKNEPHGKGQEGEAAAKWDGSKDENNWAYAATRCAEAILDVNPNALILVEGVEQSLSGAQEGDYWGMPDRKTNSPYIGAWWGGNFRGAREYPIKPKQGTSQIVYSPHDYGPSVYAQTWFAKDFTEQTLLDDYWYDTWAYINAEDIAPELIGEWGGHMEGDNLKWMLLLRDYMIKHHINHTFWCLNTNSGDTGGLWNDLSFMQGKGTTINWNEPKYEMFEEALWQTTSGKYIGLDHQIPLGQNGTGLSLSQFYASGEGSNLDAGGKGSSVVIRPTEPKVTTTTAPAVTTTTTTTQPVVTTTTTSEPAVVQTTTTEGKDTAYIKIEKLPGKTNYAIGEELDLSDGIATAGGQGKTGVKWIEESLPMNSPNFKIDASAFDNTKAGKYTIYISPANYPDVKESFTVNVVAADTQPNAEIKYGDANLDGNITLADALAILQFIANEDKYPLNAQAQKNADCFNPGDGITAMDSVAVQMYDTKKITSLPYTEK